MKVCCSLVYILSMAAFRLQQELSHCDHCMVWKAYNIYCLAHRKSLPAPSVEYSLCGWNLRILKASQLIAMTMVSVWNQWARSVILKL